MMQQMMANPQLMQNMMQAPYMQSMLQAMSADPSIAQRVIGTNPLLQNSPELQVGTINHTKSGRRIQVSNKDVSSDSSILTALRANHKIGPAQFWNPKFQESTRLDLINLCL
jgi:hypothetical protein